MSENINTADSLSIIKSLGGNTQTGMCRCPAHDDRKASLHVSGGRNKNILVRCHAGCTQEAVITALRAKGLWSGNGVPLRPTRDVDQSSAFDDYERFRKAFAILRAAASVEDTGKLKKYLRGRGITAVPEAAMLLTPQQSARFTGKSFPAMVLPVVGKDGRLRGAHVTWLTKSGSAKLATGSPRRLFGPTKGGFAVLGKLNSSKPLLIGEGIETTLSAAQITGYPAVAALSANNMVSIDPPDSEEIIIAADNDENKSGQEAARTAAQTWAKQGRTVRIALPGKPPDARSYDWNDALRSSADLQQLRSSFLAAKKIKPPRGVQALTMEEFLNMPFPERPYLMKPWLTTSGLAMIHAQRGGAKTWLALSVAYAVARGAPLMDWAVERQGRVLYVDGELPGKLLQERLAKLGPRCRDLLLLSPDLFRVRGAYMPDLGDPAGREFLDTMIDRHAIDLVVLDSLSTLVRSGVENDAESWVAIQDWVLSHRSQGRSILFVHHEGRSNKPRGTSKREDVLDTMIGLRGRPDLSKDNESAFDLTFTKSREFYGKDAAPLLVRLSTGSGRVEWSCQSADQNKRDRVEELLRAGWKNTDIAKEVGLSKGRISQIVSELKLRRHAA